MPLPTIVITRGPAIVTFNSQVFYTEAPIKAAIDWELFDVNSGQYGVVSRRVKRRMAKIMFTPVGKWFTSLWPYASLAQTLGATIMPATQKDLVIQPLDTTQKMWTFYGAGITKAPTIRLSAAKQIYGEVEFTALGKYATAPGTADSLCKRETNTFNDTSFASADVQTQPYVGTLGATAIETKEGWELSADWKLDEVTSDTFGVVNFTMEEISAKVSFTPRSLSEDDIVGLLNGGSFDKAIGGAIDAGADLVITGTGVSCTLYNLVMEKLDPIWGIKEDRFRSIELVTRRKFTTGRPNVPYLIA
ncbi:MAG: hypothetical protein WCO56_11465 [Verrucomicrobiota bacterium]